MAAILELQAYHGGSWQTIDEDNYRLAFSGGAAQIEPLDQEQTQDGSFLGTRADNPPAPLSAIINTKRTGVGLVSVDGGASKAVTALLAAECALRLRLYDAAQQWGVSSAKFFVYERYTGGGAEPEGQVQIPAPGVEVHAYEQGSGQADWTLINDASAGVGGATGGLTLAAKTPANEQLWCLALSGAGESLGIKDLLRWKADLNIYPAV